MLETILFLGTSFAVFLVKDFPQARTFLKLVFFFISRTFLVLTTSLMLRTLLLKNDPQNTENLSQVVNLFTLRNTTDPPDTDQLPNVVDHCNATGIFSVKDTAPV